MTLNEYFTEFKKKSEGGQQLQQQQKTFNFNLRPVIKGNPDAGKTRWRSDQWDGELKFFGVRN